MIRRMLPLCAMSMLLLGCASETPIQAQAASKAAPSHTSFVRGSGGPIRTELGYGIVLNNESSLQREWITAIDSTLPLKFDGLTGVRSIYKSGGSYSSGSYQYTAKFSVLATDSIAAFEVRFIAFDIWGQLIKSLSATEVKDLAPGRASFEPSWNLFSENEASEYYASIAYVARVRLKSGRVLEGDRDAIVVEARKFSKKFAPEDLDPRPAAGRPGR